MKRFASSAFDPPPLQLKLFRLLNLALHEPIQIRNPENLASSFRLVASPVFKLLSSRLRASVAVIKLASLILQMFEIPTASRKSRTNEDRQLSRLHLVFRPLTQHKMLEVISTVPW